MKLCQNEFKAMNHPLRRFSQRRIEYPLFKRMGLAGSCMRILEIGCGSGYGAGLMRDLKPTRYVGVDIMPEQIALAKRRGLPNCDFRVLDATDLCCFEDGSFDVIVIFGILHHIPTWRRVLAEARRLLVPGGRMFLEEPDGRVISAWDKIFKWGHPVKGFILPELEGEVERVGLRIKQKKKIAGFGVYSLQRGP